MNQPSLFWHDYETWGVNPAIDRPCQFAGLRTTMELQPLGDPDVWFCKPTADVLPHPEAILVTGITPGYAQEHGLDEPEFVKNINNALSQPNTCGVGYNSIRFDDEVTRFSLYRNFYDPYAREWQQGNSRWDLIDMVRTCYALRPEGMEWPSVDGKVSFRLEQMASANQLIHARAHDALSDVEATIELAKLIKQKQPALYDHIFQLRLKSNVAQMIDLYRRKPFLHISSKFPAENGCAALVVPLAVHPQNKNAIIVFDLSQDPRPLKDLSSVQIAERVFTATSLLPNDEGRIGLKGVHMNKAPIVLTPKLLTDDIAQRLNIDKALCEKHWQTILTYDLGNKIAEVFALSSFDRLPDAEQQLYEGFLPAGDRSKLEAVRSASAEGWKSSRFQFQDDRYNALLLRFKGRFHNESLSAEERVEWDRLCQKRWHEGVPGYLTLTQFLTTTDTILNQECSVTNRQKLLATKSWICNQLGIPET